jgi:hypothetical protein
VSAATLEHPSTVEIVDLADLLGNATACEANAEKHGGAECSRNVTHRLHTCTQPSNICPVAVAHIRALMEKGSRCDQHREPIAVVWRLIPV